MATFTFFHEFKEYLGSATIDLREAAGHPGTPHVYKLFLTNSTPDAAVHNEKGDLTPISSAGGYAEITITQTWNETGAGTGTWRFAASADATWTASGAAFDTFRYIVLYDDTTTSPVDALLGYWDYGTGLTLADGDSFTLDLDANYSIFTL